MKTYQPIRPLFGDHWQLGVIDGHRARRLTYDEVKEVVEVLQVAGTLREDLVAARAEVDQVTLTAWAEVERLSAEYKAEVERLRGLLGEARTFVTNTLEAVGSDRAPYAADLDERIDAALAADPAAPPPTLSEEQARELIREGREQAREYRERVQQMRTPAPAAPPVEPTEEDGEEVEAKVWRLFEALSEAVARARLPKGGG